MTKPSVNQGRWKQIRGRIKAAWGRLTHDEELRVEGNADVVLGAVEERLGAERHRVLSTLENGARAIAKRLRRAR